MRQHTNALAEPPRDYLRYAAGFGWVYRYAPRMSRREEILGRDRAAIRTLAHQHNVASIALVGSVARGTDRPDSDCDFLCPFAPGATLLDLAGLEIALEEMLGCPVQLSSERMLEEPYTSMVGDAVPHDAPHPTAASGHD